jgi:hypothetical protein
MSFTNGFTLASQKKSMPNEGPDRNSSRSQLGVHLLSTPIELASLNSNSRANGGNRKNQTSTNFFPVSNTPMLPPYNGALLGNNITGGPYSFYSTPRTSYQEYFGGALLQ